MISHSNDARNNGNSVGVAPVSHDLVAVFAAFPGSTVLFAADAPHFTILAVSDALVATARRPREAIVGRPLAEVFPEPLLATGAEPPAEPSEVSGSTGLRASLEAAVRTGTPQRMAKYRYDLARTDGVREELDWDAVVNIPVLSRDGAVRYILHQTENVTPRLRGELAVARPEQRAERVIERMSDEVREREAVAAQQLAQLEAIYRDAPVGLAVLDRQLRYLRINDRLAEINGIPASAHVGRTVYELLPEIAEQVEGVARRVFETGEPVANVPLSGETAAKPGVLRHFVEQWYPLHDAARAVIGINVVVEEVTERLRAEDALRASEARLRRMTNVEGVGVLLFEAATGVLRDANDAFLHMTGYSRRQVEAGSLTWRVMTPPEYVAASEAQMEGFARTGRIGPYEKEYFRADGSRSWMLFAGAALGDGFVVEYCIDVSARHRAESALRVSEARYRALFESIDEGFCVIEVLFDGAGRAHDYRFLEANPAFVRQTGLSDPVGRTIRELAPAHEAHWFDTYGRVALTGEPTRFEAPAVALGRWYDVYAFRVGEPSSGRVAVLFKDVSERKRADLERERLLDREQRARAAAEGAYRQAEAARATAEAANRAKGEFLAVMSHELRTPLNAIGGYAELIELGLRGPVSEQQRDDLARIQQSQRHLLGLINQVLNYTRVETGAVRYDLVDLPLAAAIAAAEALVIPQARAKGLTYLLGGCPSELTVRADREKLQQILLNLFSNAIKFTEPGGEIRVTCTQSEATTAIAVSDTGVGIASEKLSSVFEPFVQVDQRLTRPHDGVGLGLAISRDLARGMAGDLAAESTPGVGSVFTLTLPSA